MPALTRLLRLNRTSVGLKLVDLTGGGGGGGGGPQSNQRGIETANEIDAAGPEEEPQSNQRGIETGMPGS